MTGCSPISLPLTITDTSCTSHFFTPNARLINVRPAIQSLSVTMPNEFKERKSKGLDPTEFKFWTSMSYTVRVLRETLRLEAPGAGVPCYGPSDFGVLAGHRTHAKRAVMLDPRIGNSDPKLYAEPQQFEPFPGTPKSKEEESASSAGPLCGSALKLGLGS